MLCNLGDEDFCVTGITCGEDKGDCDSNIECQNSLYCGYNNCPVSLGFASEVDCCTSTQLVSPNYPNSYPRYAEETWLIAAPTGSIINLQFHSFDVRHILKNLRMQLNMNSDLFLFYRFQHNPVHHIIMLL